MVESWFSSKILGAGQNLHLFWTVSGLEKCFEKKPGEGGEGEHKTFTFQKAMKNESIDYEEIGCREKFL